jgi:hypothetical protein
MNLDKKELSGIIVAFGGGTGIFCVLDFVAFVLRYVSNKIASNFFNEKFNRINKEDFSLVKDDFQFYYFTTFGEDESSIFNDLCEKLYEFDKKYNINVFKFFPRISVKDKKRWDFEYVNEKLDKVEKINKAFICGPTTFRNDMKQILLSTKKVDPTCIQLV